MNNIIDRVWKQSSMTYIEDLQGSAFVAESGGHTFRISGVDSEENPLPLSGSVAASFLRPDQATVAISGAVSGGVVSVTLPANCYDVPGRFGLVIFLTSDGQKTAIYSCVGNVARSSTSAVAPQTTADVVDLINQINAAVATIPASYTDLMAAAAPTYSASALYPVGSYAWYDGKLYRSIVPITTAESWTAAHWTIAKLGDDVRDLKSAITETTRNLIPGKYESGNSFEVDYIISGNTVSFSGTWSRTGVLNVTDIFGLDAGTYVLSYSGNIPSGTGIGVQLRDKNNTRTIATGNGATFTLETYTEVFVRISHGTDDTKNAVYNIQIENGSTPSSFIPHITAIDAIARTYINVINGHINNLNNKSFIVNGYLENSTDLNSLISPGFYYILPARSIINGPVDYESSNSVLMICPAVGGGSTTGAIMQVFFNFTKNTLFHRIKEPNASNWSQWKQINEYNDSKGFSALGYIQNNVDLNSLTEEGFYTILSGRVLLNAPDEAENRTGIIFVYPTSSGSSVAMLVQVYIIIPIKQMHVRYRPVNSSEFTDWVKLTDYYELNPSQHGTVLETVNYSTSYSGNNYGSNLTILQYNVEHYEHMTNRKIGDSAFSDKLYAFKRLLMWANPDVCLIAEDTAYLDSDSQKETNAYLYNYILPNSTGTSEATIKSKIGFDRVVHDNVSANRPGTYVVYNNLSGKKVLVYSLHLSPGEENTSLRNSEITHVFEVIASENPDAFIIGGDFNTYGDTDRANMLSACSNNNAKCANGSYLGWIDTMLSTKLALDNLIVSNNVYINNYEVLSNWGTSLYSDHLPSLIKITIAD